MNYCHCIQSALAGALPAPKRGRTCKICRPYSCNSRRHPENLPRAIAKRLAAAPHFRYGQRAMRLAKKLAHDAQLEILKKAWAAEDAGAPWKFVRRPTDGEIDNRHSTCHNQP